MRATKLATPLLIAFACSAIVAGAPCVALANPPVDHKDEHHDKKDEHQDKKEEHGAEHKGEHKEEHKEGHR